MRNKYQAAFFLVLSLTFLGCQKSEEPLGDYLSEVFQHDLKDGLYIIIPKGSCKGCKEVVFNFLRNKVNDGKVRLVFVGEVYEAQTGNFLSRIRLKGVEVLEDPKMKIKSFDLIKEEFPIEYVSFIEVLGGKVESNKHLTPEDIAGDGLLNEFFNEHIKL